MLSRFAPFEKPVLDLDEQLEALKRHQEEHKADRSEEIAALEAKRDALLQEIFSSLSPWDQVLLARHPKRPYTLDYVRALMSDFVELHGDRCFGDDPAIVAGLARLDGRSVVVVGHQKGRDTRERQFRNFGSASAEGYRKAMRLFRTAEKFGRPVICFVDTPAAACLAAAEERGISEAIAHSQMDMALLEVPIIVVVLGEGGSGGAIGIGVGNKVYMLEHAIYSVIPPEGCAAIIWRDGSRGPEAAEALKITAQDALRLGVADEIIPEPLGGAHRDPDLIASRVKEAILRALAELAPLSPAELVEARYQRFRRLGIFERGAEAEAARESEETGEDPSLSLPDARNSEVPLGK